MENETKNLPLSERVIIQLIEDYHNRFAKKMAIKLIDNIDEDTLNKYMDGVTYD